jgi:phosphate transport system protein
MWMWVQKHGDATSFVCSVHFRNHAESLAYDDILRPDERTPSASMRHLVGILLILPELERSGDLAEHIAQRAVTNLGAEMSPLSRGIAQRMAEVAIGMWRDAADAYADRSARSVSLHEDDEEIDILHDRLIGEIATETMPTAIGAQVTLVARFYERLGDHAVNLARRIEMLHHLDTPD